MSGREDCPKGDSDRTDDEAASWFVRLRGPEGRRSRAEFERWRAASPDRAAAYARAEQIFDASGVLAQSQIYGRAQAPRGSAASARGRRHLALAACGALVLLAGSLLAYRSLLTPQAREPATAGIYLATRRGEIRSFRLADGSRVALDTASRIKVMIDGRERRIRLEAGKARFAVASDPRPFFVEAGAGRVAAKAGEFDVSFVPGNAVAVTIVDGSAVVAPMMRHADLVVPIGPVLPGEVFTYAAADFADPAQHPASSAEDTSDWPSGWADYRSVPLSRLVSEANRYAAQPIVIDDPEDGALAATGRFRLTDTEAFAQRLAEVFDLKVRNEPGAIHLAPPRKMSSLP